MSETTVQSGSMVVTSNHESAEDMVTSLSPEKPESSKPKVLVNDGQVVEEEKPKEGLSKAASDLGKKGGKAAAKARAAAAKEEPQETEAEPKETDAEPQEPEKEPSKPAAKPEEDDDPLKGLDPKGRAAVRVTRALADKRIAEAETARLRAEMALLRQGAQPQAQPQPRQAAPQGGKPNPADFELYEDYVEALTDWKTDEKLRHRDFQAAQHAQAQQQVMAQHVTAVTFAQRIAEAEKADPEIMSRVDPKLMEVRPVTALDPDEPASPANVLAEEVLRSDMAPQLLEHFSSNPKDWQRIASAAMSAGDVRAWPRIVSRAIARLEGQLASATAGKPQPRPAMSKAKPPVSPVTGAPYTDTREPDEDAPLSAFVRRGQLRELNRSSR